MAGMYATYHGKDGIQYIADSVHRSTTTLANALSNIGFIQTNTHYFDTITVKVDAIILKATAEAHEINFNYIDNNTISISINETVGLKEINAILNTFTEAFNLAKTTVTDFLEIDTIPDLAKEILLFRE